MAIAEKYLAALFIVFLTLSSVAGATYLDSVNRSNLAAQQVAYYQSRIDALNSQIQSLNSQMMQLEASNTQLGRDNGALVNSTSSLQVNMQQLASEVTQLQSEIASLTGANSGLQSQVNTLAAEVTQLRNQLTSLSRIGSLQISKIIANQVTIPAYCDTCSPRSYYTYTAPPWVAINLGAIPYSGYITVTWVSGGRFSFNAQVYNVNVTTSLATTGTFNLPVGANATNNAWFYCWDYAPNPVGQPMCPYQLTYSVTYWY